MQQGRREDACLSTVILPAGSSPRVIKGHWMQKKEVKLEDFKEICQLFLNSPLVSGEHPQKFTSDTPKYMFLTQHSFLRPPPRPTPRLEGLTSRPCDVIISEHI